MQSGSTHDAGQRLPRLVNSSCPTAHVQREGCADSDTSFVAKRCERLIGSARRHTKGQRLKPLRTVWRLKATQPLRSMSYKVDEQRTNPWLRISPSNQTKSSNPTQTIQHNRKSMPPPLHPAHSEITPEPQAPETPPSPPTLPRTIAAISTPPLRRTPTPLPEQPEKNKPVCRCLFSSIHLQSCQAPGMPNPAPIQHIHVSYGFHPTSYTGYRPENRSRHARSLK
jgi:hypothetical protein